MGDQSVTTPGERRVVPVASSDARIIGEAFRIERERQGLTTTELARKVGISQAQISRLENGKQGFRSPTLERVARALGVILRVDFGAIEPEAPQKEPAPSEGLIVE